jgi:hypothetical protein
MAIEVWSRLRRSSLLGISSWFPIMCKWNAFTIDSN